MKPNLAAMTALASSLLLTAAVGASAAPSVNLKSSVGTGSGLVDLARSGGGGGGHMSGGGGGGWGGGGGHMSGGGGAAHINGGGGGAGHLSGGGSGPSGRMASRSIDRGDLADHRGGNFKGHGRHAGNDWDGGKNWDGRHHHHHHGRFFYGPDIYVYGGGYGYDCDWLYRRAVATGSAYWWRRYQECIY